VGKLVVVSTPFRRSAFYPEILAQQGQVGAAAAEAMKQRDGGWDGSGRPKSRLAILPGLTHYTIFSAPALAATVIPFLDEPTTTRH